MARGLRATLVMPGSSGIAAARQHRQGMLDGLVRVAGKCSLALDARYQLVTRYIAHARRPWVEASRVQGSGSAESMEFVYGATPSCLRLVREGVHASKQWRQTAGVLPLGMPQGLRRGRTSMGRPSDHRWSINRAGTEERPRSNARVGARCYPSRVGVCGALAGCRACSARRVSRLHHSGRS